MEWAGGVAVNKKSPIMCTIGDFLFESMFSGKSFQAAEPSRPPN